MKTCETCIHFLPRLRPGANDWCNLHRTFPRIARKWEHQCGEAGRDYKKAEAEE